MPAGVLDAQVAAPYQIKLQELLDYDLVGFGSGIYDAKHHIKLLELADQLPNASGKKAFLFSTDGVPRFVLKNAALLQEKMRKDHETLRSKLQAKGYEIVGEFGCAGFNTNSFQKFFGGINKGRPDNQDLAQAAEFARELKEEGFLGRGLPAYNPLHCPPK